MSHKDIELVYQNTARVEDNELGAGKEKLRDYIDYIGKVSKSMDYETAESSINLSLDENSKKVLFDKIKERKNKELKYIIVVGIGGSNLGTMALYRALRGRLDVFLHENDPKMIFVDTVSPSLITQIVNFLNGQVKNPEEVLVNMVSKSGNTTETVANFEVIYSVLKKRFGDAANDRLVFTTAKGTKLWQLAEEKKIDLLEVPQKVSGRYSVLSPVGLFPLGLANFNVDRFLEGASEMVQKCLNHDTYQNPALASAILTHFHYGRGIRIYNNFYFNPELKSLGKWYTQLMAESIGKEFDTDNQKVNTGITPIVSIGSTDLHPMAQLFFAGPRDKFTQFVYASQKEGSSVVPSELFLPGLVPDIGGKKTVDIMDAIFEGVKIAFYKNGLPYSEIIMHEITEDTLGQYLQLKMIETMYLAHLLGVNAFDQPKVEDYKRETREILKKL